MKSDERMKTLKVTRKDLFENLVKYEESIRMMKMDKAAEDYLIDNLHSFEDELEKLKKENIELKAKLELFQPKQIRSLTDKEKNAFYPSPISGAIKGNDN